MPWARLDRPSIQCGLLKAIVQRHGHAADVHYVAMALADRLGPQRYSALARMSLSRTCMLGDWLFTGAAFGDHAVPAEEFLAEFPELREPLAGAGETAASLAHLQQQVLPEFLVEWAGGVDWGQYDLVGFSSTFDQNVACVALARLVKQHRPDLPVVFGGANVEGDSGAEFLRHLPSIDYVISGEGDRALPALMDVLAGSGDPAGVPGLLHRVDGQVHRAGPDDHLASLAGSPVPDYGDYFDALAAYGRDRILRGARPWLPYESSRGCWWGERHQCAFCGLNGGTIGYRSKPAAEVVSDLVELASRYECLTMSATDNVIDHAEMDELCRRLAETGVDFEIFYEVKAHLTRAQLTALRRAGVRAIQPGIESLSTHVLSLMDKGTTRLLNLRTLKWAQALRMQVAWGIITGFPGETADDYADQARLMPLLHHLPPPQVCGPLSLERYSPYFRDPAPHFTDIRPRPGYRYAYPLPGLSLDRIAYFFDYSVDGVGSAEDLALLQAASAAWREAWARPGGPPVLAAFAGPGWLRIVDTRSGALRKTTLRGLEARVLTEIGDTFHSASAVHRRLDGDAGLEDVRGTLDALCEDGLAVADNGHYLSLVLPASR